MSVAQILEQVQALSKPEREQLISVLNQLELEQRTLSLGKRYAGQPELIFSPDAIPEAGEDLEELYRNANP
jgi:hypothetical protein